MIDQFVLVIFLNGILQLSAGYDSLKDCHNSLSIVTRAVDKQFHAFCVDTKEMKISFEIKWKPDGGER